MRVTFMKILKRRETEEMTLSLISFSVQVLYGYLIRNFVSSSCEPLLKASLGEASTSSTLDALVGKCLWNFFIIINPIIILCIVSGRRRKTLIYGLKSFLKCSFSWNSINSYRPFAVLCFAVASVEESFFLAIYWVNLCLPVQWLQIPLCSNIDINYDYRKHQFFACSFSRLSPTWLQENKTPNRKNKTSLNVKKSNIIFYNMVQALYRELEK